MEEVRTETMQEVTEVQESQYKRGSVQYIDSREVAEIVGKEHDKLVRDIKRYNEQLDTANFGDISDFWFESTYKDKCGRMQKHYLVTKKGCEFIAHKLTGVKGTKFTATYINRFHEMEDALESQTLPELQKLAGRLADQQAEFIRMMTENGEDIKAIREMVTAKHTEFSRKLDILHRRQEEICNDTGEKMQRLEGIIDLRNMHYHSDREEERNQRRNPFTEDEIDYDERKRELSRLIGEIMEITDTTRPRVCHLMYRRLQEELNVSLDSYLDVVRAETGIRDLTTFDVIVRIDRFYDAAVDLCDYVIEKNTMFG